MSGKCHTCSSCSCPSLGTHLLPLRVYLPPLHHSSLLLRIIVLTYSLAKAATDDCVLALCGLQKWSRHPCAGVSIGASSPHTPSASRWTFCLSFYDLFYSLTHLGKSPSNTVPKWIQALLSQFSLSSPCPSVHHIEF